MCSAEASLPCHFNPRSPCGERPRYQAMATKAGIFQSTLPVWGATLERMSHTDRFFISIHAPRVGSDRGNNCVRYNCVNFNPRSPCGERPLSVRIWRDEMAFQSTLPVWGATGTGEVTHEAHQRFQSTLPVWGATQYFNSVNNSG